MPLSLQLPARLLLCLGSQSPTGSTRSTHCTLHHQRACIVSGNAPLTPSCSVQCSNIQPATRGAAIAGAWSNQAPEYGLRLNLAQAAWGARAASLTARRTSTGQQSVRSQCKFDLTLDQAAGQSKLPRRCATTPCAQLQPHLRDTTPCSFITMGPHNNTRQHNSCSTMLRVPHTHKHAADKPYFNAPGSQSTDT